MSTAGVFGWRGRAKKVGKEIFFKVTTGAPGGKKDQVSIQNALMATRRKTSAWRLRGGDSRRGYRVGKVGGGMSLTQIDTETRGGKATIRGWEGKPNKKNIRNRREGRGSRDDGVLLEKGKNLIKFKNTCHEREKKGIGD